MNGAQIAAVVVLIAAALHLAYQAGYRSATRRWEERRDELERVAKDAVLEIREQVAKANKIGREITELVERD